MPHKRAKQKGTGHGGRLFPCSTGLGLRLRVGPEDTLLEVPLEAFIADGGHQDSAPPSPLQTAAAAAVQDAAVFARTYRLFLGVRLRHVVDALVPHYRSHPRWLGTERGLMNRMQAAAAPELTSQLRDLEPLRALLCAAWRDQLPADSRPPRLHLLWRNSPRRLAQTLARGRPARHHTPAPVPIVPAHAIPLLLFATRPAVMRNAEQFVQLLHDAAQSLQPLNARQELLTVLPEQVVRRVRELMPPLIRWYRALFRTQHRRLAHTGGLLGPAAVSAAQKRRREEEEKEGGNTDTDADTDTVPSTPTLVQTLESRVAALEARTAALESALTNALNSLSAVPCEEGCCGHRTKTKRRREGREKEKQ